MRLLLTALACSAALAVAAGCGESDQEQAREVVQDYAEARNAGDYAAVCDLFSDEFIQELAVEDCPGFIEEQTSGADEDVSVVDVRVKDDTATADLDVNTEAGPSRIVIRLERDGDDWLIVGLQ